MLPLLLLSTLAFAQETPEIEPVAFVDSSAPLLAEGIQLIPPGTLLVFPGDEAHRFSLGGKSFLLPEPYYNTALAKARQLDTCSPALDSCTDKALELRTKCDERLNTCLGQFDVDENLVQEILTDRNLWETRALVAETGLKDALRDKWVAWAVTGGLVLGATTVTVVTLSN